MPQNSSKATVALEKYLDELINSVRSDIKNLDKTMNDKFDAQNQISKEAGRVLHEKLSQMNAFREQQVEERLTFMTKEQCESRMFKTESKTQTQEVKQAFISGRDAVLVGIPSMVALLLGITHYFFK